jgi:signal transduction histidine kinase
MKCSQLARMKYALVTGTIIRRRSEHSIASMQLSVSAFIPFSIQVRISCLGNLSAVRDEERRQIARELHDSVGQMLAALAMNIGIIQTLAPKLDPADQLERAACQSRQEARRLRDY